MLSSYKSLKAHHEGFTIIEVIIVLVIGTVIMGAVFLVVPQLQRTQRNSRRQADARRVLAAAEQYAANNQGKYPGSTGVSCTGNTQLGDCKSITDITGTIAAPGASSYTINTASNPDNDQMSISYNSTTLTCTDNALGALASAGTGNGKFLVGVAQETATGKSYWCVSN